MQLERHPLSKLWPDIPSTQFLELKADIEKHGQRYPVVIFGNQILDGWHRYKACVDLKIKPTTEKFYGTPQAAKDLVDSLNAHRRNVSESQRAFAVVGGHEWVAGQATGVARATPVSEIDSKSKTNEEMSAIAGVSQDTIIRAKKVHKSGSTALKEAVQAGEISVNKAASVIDLPKSEQLAAAKKKPERTDPVVDEKWTPDEDEEERIAQFERDHAASIDKIIASDDRIATAHAEIKRLNAVISVLTQSRNGYQNKCSELIAIVKRLQRENDRMKKAAA